MCASPRALKTFEKSTEFRLFVRGGGGEFKVSEVRFSEVSYFFLSFFLSFLSIRLWKFDRNFGREENAVGWHSSKDVM